MNETEQNTSVTGKALNSFNNELEAMSVIGGALVDLNSVELERVLNWVMSRFAGNVNLNNKVHEEDDNGVDYDINKFSSKKPPQTKIESFETAAEFFGQAKPKTHQEKILAIAAYKQVVGKLNQFDSASINKELQNFGHKVSEISKEFNKLIVKEPQLVVQLKKTGKAKQARKVYKVTIAGINYVESMLNN
ncbi:MAG: hypothetical protein JNM93_05340 [Bacteriovoracaceae bacterium]|nr:hypothetical protein [Bacteriovoracaceae bacterium]